MFLTPSDFIGKFELHKGLYDNDKLQSYIDKYEQRYLMQLLGVDLYNEFMADIDVTLKEPKSPNFKKIFLPLYEDVNLYQLIESDGMLEMLKGFVYFEYSKDQMMQQTTFGGVQQKAENSKVLNTLQTLIYHRYNEGIRTYKAIQDWILLNTLAPVGQAVDYAFVGGSGTGYLSANNVALQPLSGSALATLLLNGGSGYSTSNGVAVNGGSGTGLTLDIVDDGTGFITGISIANSGSGYLLDEVLTITGGNDDATFQLTDVTPISNGTILTADIIASAIGGVASEQLNVAGSGYTLGDDISVTGGTGTGLLINITEVGALGEIVAYEVVETGVGYTIGDLLYVDGVNSDAEIEVLTITNGEIEEINIVDGGINWQVEDCFLVTGGDAIIELTYVGKGILGDFKGQRKGMAYWL